ncbi:MAG: YkgJ family cysteine cluster protein, partial [Kiritimatiellia bacterium]
RPEPMTGYPDRPVWFEAGLRFECTRCGACCAGAPGRVLVSDVEIRAIAGRLGLPEAVFRSLHLRPDPGGWSLKELEGGDCEFLHDGRCSIQECKPRQCRTYPFWLNNLRSPEAWEECARVCPGIGLGRTYSRTEILDQVFAGPTAT